MRIIIIGGVAAGTSAAAKARRNSETAEIVIYDKDSHISYAGCGMPYYLGGEIESADELAPRDSAFFKAKYNVDVHTKHEVLSINSADKTLEVRNLLTDKVFTDSYDKLIIATGAQASVPPIQGVKNEHVFTLRTITDMNKIKSFFDSNNPKSTVIVGTGFIGLEMAENLVALGTDVTMVEMLPQVTPGLDSDMAIYVEEHLNEKGVTVFTETSANEITDDSVVLSNGKSIPADLVILATGARPNVELARQAGVEIGTTGAIKVDEKMRTNIDAIYAAGDCAEQFHVVTGKPVYRPLGSTANKTGRIAGHNVTGGDLSFRGVLGTGIFQVFDLTVAQTGLSEREAREAGYDVVINHNIKPNKPEYMNSEEMNIKGIADRKTSKLLGAQIIGGAGVDKRIDVLVTAITFGAKVHDLFHLDLAYAPPYSSSKDPVMYTGMIFDNIINGERPLITAKELNDLINSGEKVQVIDTRAEEKYEEAHITGAINIPLVRLRESAKELDKNLQTVVYCNRGITGNAAQSILLNLGFNKVYNLSGGHTHYSKVNS